MFVSFLEGLVPWTRWAWVRRRSGHSDWTATQAGWLVKGRQTLHWRTSWTETARTTESLVLEMKEHTWQISFSQAAAFWLAKSDGKIAAPEMYLTEAWKWLTTDKKVDTRRLAENSPRQSFSYAWMQGLLSVRMQAFLTDWIRYRLKCFAAAAIERASTSHGSHVVWEPRT